MRNELSEFFILFMVYTPKPRNGCFDVCLKRTTKTQIFEGIPIFELLFGKRNQNPWRRNTLFKFRQLYHAK